MASSIPQSSDRQEIRFQFSVRTLLIIFGLAAGGAALAATFKPVWLEIATLFLVLSVLVLILSHDHPLRFFLKYVNPVVALVILVICIFSSSTDLSKDTFDYQGWFKGPIQSYFFAKGIFCSLAIFLLGKLIEIQLQKNSTE